MVPYVWKERVNERELLGVKGVNGSGGREIKGVERFTDLLMRASTSSIKSKNI